MTGVQTCALPIYYWPEGTNRGRRRDMVEMTAEQVQEYLAGYEENEQSGDKKNWG